MGGAPPSPTPFALPTPTPRRRGASRIARPAAAGPPTPPPAALAVPTHPYRRSRESGNPGQGRGEGRLRPPPSHPPLPTARALPASVRPEPVEACPEGTRRGPPRHQPPPPQPPSQQPPPPSRAPHGTLTRPPCPHSLPSANVSSWQSQSPTATETSRVPTPSGASALSSAAWSASMVRGGSASIRRGCLYSAKKFLDL